MLKQVSSPLELFRTKPANKILQVCLPNLTTVRKLEKADTSFINLIAFFKKLVFLEQKSEVKNDLWRRYAEIDHTIVHRLSRI